MNDIGNPASMNTGGVRMARYKHIDTSPRFLPIDLARQLVPGTFEYALNHLLLSIWGQTRHIIGQWPFSIEDGTLDRAQGSAVAEGEAEEAGRRVIPINRV
jgi:hypothetical protein